MLIFVVRRALQFEAAWQRAYEAVAFADAQAAGPGLDSAIPRLTGGGRKSRDHRYLRLEKRLKMVVLLLTRTAFKVEGLSVLVPKENRVEFQTLLDDHRIVWPAALPVIIVKK